MASADYRWLAVPAILIVALGIVLLLNQPKVTSVDDPGYIDVDGDEYLPQDYITDDELQVGDTEFLGTASDYDFPESVSDCTGRGEGEKDSCLLIYSALNEDSAGCGAMDDPDLKQGCFHRAAEISLNADFCADAGIERQGCYVDVAVGKNDASLCPKGRMNIDQCNAAVQANDLALCPESVDRIHCNDAIVNNDPSQCGLTERLDGFCYYSIATQTADASLCANAGSAANTCYFNVAEQALNADVCERMTENRDYCVAWVAFITADKALCARAGTEAQSCAEDIDAEYG